MHKRAQAQNVFFKNIAEYVNRVYTHTIRNVFLYLGYAIKLYFLFYLHFINILFGVTLTKFNVLA